MRFLFDNDLLILISLSLQMQIKKYNEKPCINILFEVNFVGKIFIGDFS